MENQQSQGPNVDLKTTTSIETPDGNQVFQQGVLLRKVSKFIVGAEEDAVMPIPVFYDPISGKILGSTIPLELREEYKEYSI
tara:strand:+ start:222 stop:467 length:246 start_codon:yes stop_codon:yes gene_type:complete